MSSWNMRFVLFLVDSRPFDELLPLLDEMFGGHFEQDLEYKADGILRYTNYVFGIGISCLQEDSWPEGRVYRFIGGNDNCCRFDTLDELDIGFHVRRLLDGVKLERVMSFDEYRAESKRREQAGK